MRKISCRFFFRGDLHPPSTYSISLPVRFSVVLYCSRVRESGFEPMEKCDSPIFPAFSLSGNVA